MICALEDVTPDDGAPVLFDVDPARIAALNQLPASLLEHVPNLRAYATDGYEAGLATIAVGTDVNVSFVATVPQARRRGLGTAVTRAALIDARDRGFATATLQATTMAEGLYSRLGFAPVGMWQEWIPG
jgi:ribosomal protein S18 acetylase RimI-like enzyme